MRHITLANLRSGAGRLVAAGVAVMISVAFIASVLSLSAAWNDTMRDQAEGSAAGSDLIVAPDYETESSEDITPAVAKKLTDDAREVPTIAGTQTMSSKFAKVTNASGQYFQAMPQPLGRQLDMAEGSAPAGKHQVMVYQDVAKSAGIEVGQRLTLKMEDLDSTGDGEVKNSDKTAHVNVSGIARGSDGGEPALYASETGFSSLPGTASIEGMRAVLDDSHAGDADAQSAAAHALAKVLADQRNSTVEDKGNRGLVAAGFTVQTNHQVVDEEVEHLTGGTFALQAVVLGFGVIALFVAALVISNTFQVIVASRTRTLALLRAIGATRGQIQGATLLEGLVLGLIGSAAGILLGWGAAVGLGLAARAWWLPSFAMPGLPVSAVVGGLLVGVIVTVLACVVPARKATRVTPIQALMPVDVPTTVGRVPLARTIVGCLLLLAGLSATVAGAVVHNVPIALLGAILAFGGVLVSARVVVPPLVTAAGRLLEKLTHGGSVPGLVARNVRLVPRRTASTASALLIGVTLVTTMMVGAQTIKTSSDAELAESNAVDVSVTAPSQKMLDALRDSDIVTDTSRVDGAKVTVPEAKDMAQPSQDDPDSDEKPATQHYSGTVLAATQDGVSTARDTKLLPPRGTVYVDENEYPSTDDDAPKPARVTLKGKHGSVKVTVEFGHGVPSGTIVGNAKDLKPLQPTASQGAAWSRVTDDADASDVQKLETALGDSDNIDAIGAELRSELATIINIVLVIVLALLAASLVVAVVGVANTLSLSVMERRRETALLRAMGMTRGQVSSMVTLEAVLIGIVAIVVGLVLGVFFSWAGISSLLEDENLSVVVGLPWLQLLAVVVVALLAALLASVIPARAVNRTKPAEGLSA